MKKNIVYLFLAVIAFINTACDSTEDKVGTATLHVRLTDAPGDFSAVFIDIKGVEINASSVDEKENWVTLENTKAGVYDLLKLTNGINTLIAS